MSLWKVHLTKLVGQLSQTISAQIQHRQLGQLTEACRQALNPVAVQ
jgi:hypothetical protein